jgi:hypothetical protein
VTTFEPGASEDLTHGFRRMPRSTAFFASSPAPIITCGFEVFVQEVIAAMTTEPCCSSNSSPFSEAGTLWGRRATATAPSISTFAPVPTSIVDGGSLAGNDSATASSREFP